MAACASAPTPISPLASALAVPRLAMIRSCSGLCASQTPAMDSPLPATLMHAQTRTVKPRNKPICPAIPRRSSWRLCRVEESFVCACFCFFVLWKPGNENESNDGPRAPPPLPPPAPAPPPFLSFPFFFISYSGAFPLYSNKYRAKLEYDLSVWVPGGESAV